MLFTMADVLESRAYNIIKVTKSFMLDMAIHFGVCPISECLPGNCFTHGNIIPFASVMNPWFKWSQKSFPRNLELGPRAGVSELGRDDNMACTVGGNVNWCSHY